MVSKNDKYIHDLSKVSVVTQRMKHHRKRSSENVDIFWKSFAIFLLITFVLAIIVSLTVYFIYRTNWL